MSDEPKIEPRVMDGIPMCVATCGSYMDQSCQIDGSDDDFCPPAVKQMAEKIREFETDAEKWRETVRLINETPIGFGFDEEAAG